MNETMVGAVIIDPLNGKIGTDHLQEGEVVINCTEDIFDDNNSTTQEICDECQSILHIGGPVMVKYHIKSAHEATTIQFANLDELKSFLLETPFTLVYKIIKRKDTGRCALRYFPEVGYTSLEHYETEEFVKKLINDYRKILPKNIASDYIEELSNLLTSHLSKRFGDK